MWWRGQNIDKPITDSFGKIWNFRVWHDFIEGIYVQRIFFWDEGKEVTGLIEFNDDQTIDHKKIKQRIVKIINNPVYRQKHICELKFPVERNY